jgi:uncharacterized protein YbbC (DUF1343 family)
MLRNLVSKTLKYSPILMAMLVMPALTNAQLREPENLKVGAERGGAYLPIAHEYSVAVVANQTSMVDNMHLVDFLVDRYVNVSKVFAPEHGFRGEAGAGEKVNSGKDAKTGLPIVSLYGSNKKPTAEQLADVGLVIFDIQDVGARFYTYISTMTYVMEACAEQGKKMIILDRPNPNGYYVDGPVLKPGYESFVGMHQVPVVHGMTVGEYAMMVNGEGWLKGGVRCDLEVIKCEGWDHLTSYELPVKPSPNLPNAVSITLYPSLCFFEGTTVSVGRGTDLPFQQMGAPWFEEGTVTFTPRSMASAKHPKYEGEECRGYDLREFATYYMKGSGELYLFWLKEAYDMAPEKESFFNNFFDKLAGTDQLRKDIIAGKSVMDIRSGWQEDLEAFKLTRNKYLLYKDFE